MIDTQEIAREAVAHAAYLLRTWSSTDGGSLLAVSQAYDVAGDAFEIAGSETRAQECRYYAAVYDTNHSHHEHAIQCEYAERYFPSPLNTGIPNAE